MTIRKIITWTTLGAMSLAAATPLAAAPLAPAVMTQDRAELQQVQFRHRHGGPGWHHGPRHGYYGHRHYGSGAAVLGGLAAGAVIGGAIANSRAAADSQAYCQQRYRSYDPASGTYLSNDGMRRPCP